MGTGTSRLSADATKHKDQVRRQGVAYQDLYYEGMKNGDKVLLKSTPSAAEVRKHRKYLASQTGEKKNTLDLFAAGNSGFMNASLAGRPVPKGLRAAVEVQVRSMMKITGGIGINHDAVMFHATGFKDPKKGKVQTFNEFVSLAYDPNVAEGFLFRPGQDGKVCSCMWRIRVPKGRKGIFTAAVPGKGWLTEFTLHPPMKVKVLSVIEKSVDLQEPVLVFFSRTKSLTVTLVDAELV